MDIGLDAVLDWMWQGAVVALAADVLLRLMRRSPAQHRYLVCAAAMIAVAALPFVAPLLAIAAAAPGAAPAAAGVPRLISLPTAWWTSGAAVAGMWLAWVAVHGLRLAAAEWVVRRWLRRCRPIAPAVEARLRHWTQVRRGGRGARLVVSDDVRTAAVLGCGRPAIAVAPALLQRLEADDLDRVLIHEWAHVQRRDDIAHAAENVVLTIAGWHPAVWWIDRRLRIERESACDETAVAVTGSAKAYASCLATVAGLRRGRAQLVPALGALSSPVLSQRIARIVSRRDGGGRVHPALTITAAVVLLFSLVSTIGAVSLVSTIAPPSPTIAPPDREGGQRLDPRVATDALALAPATPRAAPRAGSQRTSATPGSGDPAAGSGQPPAVTVQVASQPAQPVASSPHPEYLRATRPIAVSDLTAALPSATSAFTARPAPPRESATGSDEGPSPWDNAAASGIAAGKTAQKAAQATAGRFKRFAQSIASSF